MDFARSRGSLKRSGAAPAVSLGEAIEVPSEGGRTWSPSTIHSRPWPPLTPEEVEWWICVSSAD